MKASEFKAKCLKLMDEVAESGQEIIITKNGRPRLQARPLPQAARHFLRCRQGENQDTRRHRFSYAGRVVPKTRKIAIRTFFDTP